MPRAKFLLKLFSKSLRFPQAAPWSLSAESEMTTGFSFCKAFSFGPFASKEKALWAENLLKKGLSSCFAPLSVKFALQTFSADPYRFVRYLLFWL